MLVLNIVRDVLAIIGGICVVTSLFMGYYIAQTAVDDELIAQLNQKEENDEV